MQGKPDIPAYAVGRDHPSPGLWSIRVGVKAGAIVAQGAVGGAGLF